MKGPFSLWAFFGLTIWIDAFTLVLFAGKKKKKVNPNKPLKQVTVIIPAFREEQSIEKTIEHITRSIHPIKNIIVCGDRYSARMQMIVENLASAHKNLIYLECPKISKAKKINYAVKTLGHRLAEYVYIRDARVIDEGTCIRKMLRYFDNEQVAAVTSYGRVSIPKNILSRAYHYGKAWVNEIGRFRKLAQELRRAVFVVCGASTIYRTKVLMKHPMPSGSKTEDTYYTWILQRKGFIVKVADDAIASAPDVDGRYLHGIISQLKQSYRWSSGTLQCFYREVPHFRKNKRLFFTTIFPGFLESFTYSVALVLLPLFIIFLPVFALAFLIGDAVFSLLGTLILMPKKFFKTILHYPEIFFFKYTNSAVFVLALIVVTLQFMTGATKRWTNEWVPPQTS